VAHCLLAENEALAVNASTEQLLGVEKVVPLSLIQAMIRDCSDKENSPQEEQDTWQAIAEGLERLSSQHLYALCQLSPLKEQLEAKEAIRTSKLTSFEALLAPQNKWPLNKDKDKAKPLSLPEIHRATLSEHTSSASLAHSGKAVADDDADVQQTALEELLEQAKAYGDTENISGPLCDDLQAYIDKEENDAKKHQATQLKEECQIIESLDGLLMRLISEESNYDELRRRAIKASEAKQTEQTSRFSLKATILHTFHAAKKEITNKPSLDEAAKDGYRDLIRRHIEILRDTMVQQESNIYNSQSA